jgi:hypothetical protein
LPGSWLNSAFGSTAVGSTAIGGEADATASAAAIIDFSFMAFLSP